MEQDSTKDVTITSAQRRRVNNFANGKIQCLGKRDKSSAGRIDPHVVEICAVLNEFSTFYTTSSCAGRCFLYRGPGIKSTTSFHRFRVNHDKIGSPDRYFDLSTLQSDPTGGGDPLMESVTLTEEGDEAEAGSAALLVPVDPPATVEGNSVWLRYEPFILHVACRSLKAASTLMAAARPAFKNVGLTTWKESRYLIAIWGDEGLDLPLTTPDGVTFLYRGHTAWLADLVNERQDRNWNKIDRFVQAAREMIIPFDDDDDGCHDETENTQTDPQRTNRKIPKSFDVIGDVAIFQPSFSSASYPRSVEEWQAMGEALLQKNKAIKVVALKTSHLEGPERANHEGLQIIAGWPRSPLMTTHVEYGIKAMIDMNQTFFSPRMGPERLRICQQVARGEHVLVLFAGVAMDALQIAGRTQAASVVAVELNPVAVRCARRSHELLQRNKAVQCPGATERLQIVEGDALEILPTLPRNHFDRILAPRPKEGSADGDLGTGNGGMLFLEAMIPVMRMDGSECHWYDFVADHEFPACERSRKLIAQTCESKGLVVEFLHVARVGSVAMRQFRVCIDFRTKQRHDYHLVLQ